MRHATEETARNTVGVCSGAAIETFSVFCLCAKMEKTKAEIVAKIIIRGKKSPLKEELIFSLEPLTINI